MAERERYTAKQFIAAIPGTNGIVREIARRVGCSWPTAQRYIALYATVKKAYDAERESALDIAETRLLEAITAGESWAIRFYLATIGKARGYTLRQEVTGAAGAPLVIRFTRYGDKVGAALGRGGATARIEDGERGREGKQYH